MMAEKTSYSWWLRCGHLVLTAVVILCGCSLMLGCKKTSGAAAGNAAAKAEDPATRDLRAIGDRVTAAMLAKNTNTLLEYDHDPEDQASLNNKSGDLYCFLFDSSCIPGGKARSVYEILTTARQGAIDASVAEVNGKRYGLLMFYDKSQISDKELYSPEFLCSEKALQGTASWHFVLADGKWSTTTLFDYKTERPCKK